MSSETVLDVPFFTNWQEEVTFWRETALDYKSKYEALFEATESISKGFNRSQEENTDDDSHRKEMKLELETMNPLHKLHEDLHPHIVQHLGGFDLLELSEVSTEWHDTAITDKTMGKIKLNLSNQPFGIIIDSERNYKHVEAMLNETAKFKCIEIIKKHAETLEKLVIGEKVFEAEIQPTHFPKLKKLELNHIPKDIQRWINSSHFDSLTHLTIELECNDFDDSCDFFKFILQLSSLKTLILSSSQINICLYQKVQDLGEDREPLPAPTFKLKELLSYYAPTDIFWQSQAESLEKLIVILPNTNFIATIFADLPRLFHLTILMIGNFAIDENLELPTNNIIETLFLLGSIHVSVVKKIMLAVPQVVCLHFGFNMTTELLEWIAKNMKNVEKLVISSKIEDGIEEKIRLHYENMKQRNSDINKNIELQILE